ncbi:MAG: hypothetical protein GY815_10960, partial [Gammaproteobacteria bacterium]|nr:hypothetical protein [Gammaproteobacteria bacterium]
ITGNNTETTWLINTENGGSVGGLTFEDFHYLVGGTNNDTFIIADNGSVTGTIDGGLSDNTLQRSNITGDNDWLITGDKAGSLTYDSAIIATFSNINTLVGSSTQEVTDTLTGRSDYTTIWLIDGTDTVTTSDNTINFSAMENLTGGTNDDTFTFNGGSISGTIDADGHINGDIVDYSSIEE